ncbi:hypothetical protein ACFV6Y_38580, partial [Streptomyces massasporeus]|uniref:hypothetical protein n=1 Tax=Streptomyces massasporeus TaxID=67324 RepID=UPI00364F2089
LALPHASTWRGTFIETYERMEPGAPRGTTRHVVTAHFGVEPGAVLDVQVAHTSQSFEPDRIRVQWSDAELYRITLSGRRRLVAGGVSAKQYLNREWYRAAAEISHRLYRGETSVRAAGITGVRDGETPFVPVPLPVLTTVDAYLDVHPLPELTFWQPNGEEVRA